MLSTSLPSASRVELTPPSASFSPGVRPYLQHACACGLTYLLQMRRTSVRRRSAQRAYPCSWRSASVGAFSARRSTRQPTDRATCALSHLPVVLLMTDVCEIEKDSWVRARQYALCGHDVNEMLTVTGALELLASACCILLTASITSHTPWTRPLKLPCRCRTDWTTSAAIVYTDCPALVSPSIHRCSQTRQAGPPLTSASISHGVQAPMFRYVP
jgi:hypothetical protein